MDQGQGSRFWPVIVEAQCPAFCAIASLVQSLKQIDLSWFQRLAQEPEILQLSAFWAFGRHFPCPFKLATTISLPLSNELIEGNIILWVNTSAGSKACPWQYSVFFCYNEGYLSRGRVPGTRVARDRACGTPDDSRNVRSKSVLLYVIKIWKTVYFYYKILFTLTWYK